MNKLEARGWKLIAAFRGVSSTVKLSVSKTELGGSNPSAPARIENRDQGSEIGDQEIRESRALITVH